MSKAEAIHRLTAHVAPDRCEACGRRHKSVLTLGHAFRQREIRSGRADPGPLCFGCADL
jgi:hypothetical protein